MESRAKQRLTGAIILVALFVLLVPELLTGPRDAHPDSTTNDEGMRRVTIDLDAQRAASNPMAPAQEPAVSLPPVVTPMNSNPERAVPGEAAAPVATPANPMAPAPVPQAARTEAARTESPRADTPRAEPPRTPPASRPVEAGSFVVQIGTFSVRENADRLVRDMSAKGFTAFVVPVSSNGHELYRVRVGPTRDRASAEGLAKQLKQAGQSGSIVPIS